MDKYYIYKITNKLNGKSYVGQHKVPQKPESFRRYMGKGIAITKAIKKYGKENFDKIVLEELEDDEKHELVSEKEKFWIKKENTMYPNGYNISPGGEGGCSKENAAKGVATRRANNYRHSEETKRKISEAHKGRKFSDEHKRHLSENHHLKTLHIIVFEDGHKEETHDSLTKIAKRFETTQNKLLRSSAKKQFLNGIMLEGVKKEDYACCRQEDNSSKILCRDPIVNDITSLRNLRLRKKRKLDIYALVEPKQCIIEEVPHEIQSDC